MSKTPQEIAYEMVVDFFDKLAKADRDTQRCVWHLLTALRGPDQDHDDNYCDHKNLTTIVRKALMNSSLANVLMVSDCDVKYRHKSFIDDKIYRLDHLTCSALANNYVTAEMHFLEHIDMAFKVLRTVKDEQKIKNGKLLARDRKGRFSKKKAKKVKK